MTEEIAILEHRTPNTEHRTPNTEPQDCPKFSIIVPVYNCEKYITKCLDSLINQDITARNYELVITDDGSTDQTAQILDAYAEKFPFIHVTHTQNFGPSHARNVALAQCRGEYITFCDGDDYVSTQLVSVLTKAVEVYGRPDFLVWRHYDSSNFPVNGFPVYDVEGMKESECEFFDGEELCFRILLDNVIGGFSFNKALRRELIGNIRFDEGLTYCEDVDWFIRLITQRESIRVCRINHYLYHYVYHKNIGLTRDAKCSYTQDGMPKIIDALEKVDAIKNLPQRVSLLVKANLYCNSILTLYGRPVPPIPEVRRKLISYGKQYALTYYTSPRNLKEKLKVFIKHSLVLMHIHKPNR